MAEGVVPGGGLALLRAIEAVEREGGKCEGDERTGLQILRRALETPTRQIAENSSVDGGVVVNQMRKGTGNWASTPRREYVDLVEPGIIDPTKVVRVALENAVSVASLLLLTEATLTRLSDGDGGSAATPAVTSLTPSPVAWWAARRRASPAAPGGRPSWFSKYAWQSAPITTTSSISARVC